MQKNMAMYPNSLKFFSDKLESAQRENEVLQEEHDRLLLRHNKSLQDLNEKEENFRRK